MLTVGNWWADEKYSHERRVELGKKTQKYFKDGACIYTNESVATIYAVVSNTTAENEVVANDFYCCPFCHITYDMKEENWVITEIGKKTNKLPNLIKKDIDIPFLSSYNRTKVMFLC